MCLCVCALTDWQQQLLRSLSSAGCSLPGKILRLQSTVQNTSNHDNVIDNQLLQKALSELHHSLAAREFIGDNLIEKRVTNPAQKHDRGYNDLYKCKRTILRTFQV